MSHRIKQHTQALSFEDRCSLAQEGLLEAWQKLLPIIENDEEIFRRMREDLDRRILQVPENERAALQSQFEIDVQNAKKSSQNIITLTWQGTVASAKLTFGAEATEHALAMIKQQSHQN